MKRLLLLTLFLILLSCGSSKFMMNTIDGYYNKNSVDSICTSEVITTNLDKWITFKLVDYETFDTVYEYMFIKSLKENETIYTIVKTNDSTYHFIKRITQNKK